MESPKISVVMPAYNAEKYIAEAIESILNQTFRDFEFIIIDDASTDNTGKIIAEYAKKDNRIKVFTNEKNLYISKTLNLGLSCAQSEIIARMDADDISLPERLEKQYKKITENNDIAVVGTYIRVINEKGDFLYIRKYPLEDKKLKRNMFKYSPFAHPVVMYRKKVVIEFRGYLPVYSPSEDLNLWFRVGTKYKFATVPEVLFEYRFFSDSHSNRKLKTVEIKTLKMRWYAYRHQGYKPSFFDVIYNIGQASTLFIMPTKMRISLFNFIRRYI